MSKVSVIIPVYNTEKYLRECLDSVVNQTLKDIEIICIDDGSTDLSLDILKEYSSKDKRFVIKTQNNLHAGVARNKGIELASGEYVHFLDSDDWLDVNAYERLYNLSKENSTDIVKFKAFSYNNQTKEVTSRAYLDIEEIEDRYFNKSFNLIEEPLNTVKLPDSPWSGFYNLNFIKNNNIYFDNFICANDVGFFFRCIINAKNIYLSPEKLVYYRENLKNSLITKRAKHFECQIALYKVVKSASANLPISYQQIVVNKIINDIFHWYDICINEYTLSKEDFTNMQEEMNAFLKEIENEYLFEKNLKVYKRIKSDIKNRRYSYILSIKKLRAYRFISNLLTNIFSVTNIGAYKVITILGMKIKIKRRKRSV